MVARRILLYFLIASAVAVATTAVFEIYSLRRAADRATKQHLLLAQSVARFVGGLLEDEGRNLRRLVSRLPKDSADFLRERRAKTFDGEGLVVYDANASLVELNAAPGAVPKRATVQRAVQRVFGGAEFSVSDIYRGSDGRPRVGLFVSSHRGGRRLVVMTPIRLDAQPFLRVFRYFVVNDRSRMQVLDSQGVALFSTRKKERYRSVVHSTYFTKRLRTGGKAEVMQCHSCHVGENDASVKRTTEFMTIAPIAKSDWSVTFRESADDVLAPVQEVAYTSVALASVILGVFVGFFLLLSRRVVRPIRELTHVAAEIAQGAERVNLPVNLTSHDEFGSLARSLETMRQRAAPEEKRGGLVPTATAEVRLVTSRQEARQAMERSLDAMLGGLVDVSPVCAAILAIEGEPDVTEFYRASGIDVALEAEGDEGGKDDKNALVSALLAASVDRSEISPSALAKHGVRISGDGVPRTFLIQRLEILNVFRGELWIGVASMAEDLRPYLAPTLELVAANIHSLVTRHVLYDRLREEHELKNRMLRHLFEAEDEERRRIAREIHDETAQTLTALLLVLETIPENDPAGQAKRLDQAKQLVQMILEQTDRLIRRLRPAMLDDLGLVEALRATGHNMVTLSGMEFDFVVEGADAELPKEIEVAVYRVLQEAFTNILRHAEATTVAATLKINDHQLEASIEDDGRGMDLSWKDDPKARPRWGLLGMQERIFQLGGTIDFGKAELGGTRIAFSVPLKVSGGGLGNGAGEDSGEKSDG